MIEAIVEDEAVKAKVFAALDEVITDPDAVLASNTSSIPIMKIAAATKNPSRVLGLHFFNPVPVLPLVELISTLVTSDEAVARTEEFAGGMLGKKVVRCGDRSGFIVNALLVPYLLSAIRMAEAGVATVEDIDTAVVAGLSHPMGPLRLSDLIGLDTMKLIADSMYDEYKDPGYAPPPLLLRMVEAASSARSPAKGSTRTELRTGLASGYASASRFFSASTSKSAGGQDKLRPLSASMSSSVIGQPAVPLLVARDDVPRRVVRRRPVEHGLVGLLVLGPQHAARRCRRGCTSSTCRAAPSARPAASSARRARRTSPP